MFDHEFTKYEVATYLREFNKLLFYASEKTNESFFEIFKTMLGRDGKKQYGIASHYNEMIDIYEIVLLTRFLTQVFDNYFMYLEDDAIESLNISTDFVITTKKVTKKQLIKDLIGSFKDPKTYRIIRVDEDGRTKIKLEILYMTGRKQPFHAIVNIPTLSRICKELLTAVNTSGLESNRVTAVKTKDEEGNEVIKRNIYLRKYYLSSVMAKKNKQNILAGMRNNMFDELNPDDIDLIFLQNGMDCEDYYYTQEQLTKVTKDMAFWNKMKNKGYDVEGYKPIDHALGKTMPFSCLKTKTLFMNYVFVDNYLGEFDKTLREVARELQKLEHASSPLSPFGLYRKIFKKSKIDPEYLDFESILSVTNSIYYGYLFENLVDDEYVKLDNNHTVKKENVVNAYKNMTWSIEKEDTYSLHDYTDVYQTNEVLNASIGFQDLANTVEAYYQTAIAKVEDETFMDLPIHFMSQRLSNGMNKMIGISCIKNKKYYFYNIFNDLLLVSDGKESNRYPTGDELAIFINELENLSEAEKRDFKDQIEEIKNVLMEEIVFEGAKTK